MSKKKRQDYTQKIKLSTTFPARTLCSRCHKGPCSYFFSKNNKLYKNHRFIINQFDYVVSHTKRMCKNFYLQDYPKNYNSIGLFNYSLNYKGYNPKLHRTRGVSNNTNFTEYLMCYCGETIWTFNYKSTVDRKEIAMRQAIKTFTKKYE